MDPLPSVELIIERLRNICVRFPDGPVRIEGFGDSAALSKALLGLIIDGHKRAGASLLWAHEAEKNAYQEVGEIEIIVVLSKKL